MLKYSYKLNEYKTDSMPQLENFLTKLIHSRLIAHLKALQLEPLFISVINLSDADLFEIRELYPTARIRNGLLHGDESSDLIVMNLAIVNEVNLNQLFLEANSDLTETGIILLVTINHASKSLIAQYAKVFEDQLSIDDNAIYNALNLNPLLSFVVSREPVITVGKEE